MPANCHSEALKNIAAMIKLYSESCLHDFKRAESDGHAVRGETEPSALAEGNVEFSAASDFKRAESDGHAVRGETEPSAHVSLNHAFGERLISRERVTTATPD